jgi:hypothetical protein
MSATDLSVHIFNDVTQTIDSLLAYCHLEGYRKVCFDGCPGAAA